MIEVGEYVRTNKGNIGNVIDIFQGHCTAKYHIQFQGNVKVKRQYLSTKTIVKHSKNIIDLIELYDYINGMIVFDIITYDNGEKAIKISGGSLIEEEEIKDILTHEQFEQNCYKIDTN